MLSMASEDCQKPPAVAPTGPQPQAGRRQGQTKVLGSQPSGGVSKASQHFPLLQSRAWGQGSNRGHPAQYWLL
jgi:hypothetical protein